MHLPCMPQYHTQLRACLVITSNGINLMGSHLMGSHLMGFALAITYLKVQQWSRETRTVLVTKQHSWRSKIYVQSVLTN